MSSSCMRNIECSPREPEQFAVSAAGFRISGVTVGAGCGRQAMCKTISTYILYPPKPSGIPKVSSTPPAENPHVAN